MPVKFTWHGDDLFKEVEKKRDTLLYGIGNLGVNNATSISHVDTGLSKNAKHYLVSRDVASIAVAGASPGEFGKFKGKNGRVETPRPSDIGTPPTQGNTVSVIAPLEYDVYLERRYGIMKRAFDATVKQVPNLIKKALRV